MIQPVNQDELPRGRRMSYSFSSSDFKAQPYWWDKTEPAAPNSGELPLKTDVLIIGSGYTGLHCALQTARAGRQTLVIDAEAAGWGCSSRNGGQISGEIKPGYQQLARRHGKEKAFALVAEARRALNWLGDFVESESIDCDYRRCGRFVAAHNPARFRTLVEAAKQQPVGLEQPLQIIPPGEQASEIDSEFYHGGMLIEHHCSLDPAKYHRGLMQLAQGSGVEIHGNCRALQITRTGQGFRVTTSRGDIETGELVIATSGYTGAVTPWQQRRIIPIGSYMLATEPMPIERAARLMPGDRVFSDTRRLIVYFRRSPDGRRLIFGGRVSVFESDAVKSLPALRREMLRIFPQLADVAISHSWMGFVGFSFDYLPHLGKQDGIYYAMGYCGSGICLASYFGHHLGQQLLQKPDSEIAFNNLQFQTRPFYHGKPWFLASAVRYYQLLDRIC